ncbi:MAG: magnesium transporter CorA family protein [Lentisphaerae bacterium]|nr:magnesium transporter CorA family protein [Lentisphaerota bacterium]
MLTVVAFNFETRTETTLAPADLPAALATGAYGWVDVDCSPCATASTACAECRLLLAALGINAMALDEVIGPDREGRYDVYEDCLHFAVSEARFEQGRLVAAHVDIILAERFIVTFRRRGAEFLKHMRRTYRDDFIKFAKSPGFLIYEIGDHLIESYRRTLRGFSDAVEQVQLNLFSTVDDTIFRHVADLTQDILLFRKIVLAARELMHELSSRRSPFVSESTQPFLHNMAGTLERLGSDITTEREVLNESLNLYMGMVSHRTNKVVNRLTTISAIFLPLSFLCGVYGMNLPNMPEMSWKYGYAFFWAVALTIAGTLLVVMKRRKWI